MKARVPFHNHVVAALLALHFAATPALAQDKAKLDGLFERLQAAQDAGEAGRIESEILIEWSKSGSAAMDLLYQRGTDALALGNGAAAVEHLTAVIDHAPDFAAAYDARAAAYYVTGDIGPALADLAHVLTVEPRHFAALAGLGAILEETGQKEKALAAYRMAAEIHPHLADVKAVIGRLAAELEGRDL
ncbi:hypothetical protein [Pseudogemmobacter sonorensis]|uniref:hypothetical protein n=1 Tax=Pseudogemmobacter sonorensis TaxID=2989681 RepID=UPI0036AB5C82